MRKLFLGAFALAFGFAASDAHAAYFYWKVAQEAGGYEFSYASLYDYATETTFNVGDSATAFAVGADASGISTLTTSAKLDDGIGSGNSFFVRLFADDGTVVANSTVFGYDDIVEKHVYADLGTSADGRGYAVSSFVGAIPEPTSGCLFLLGLAALALRRKNRALCLVPRALCGKDKARSTKHKAQILALALVAICETIFGAANDVVLTFSTSGPDTYADGTGVVDGESYALIWTKTGSTFGGISSDGSLLSADDRLVLVAGVAEAGRCPTTVFEIDAEDAANYNGGTFALYLLDTRVRDADGKVAVAGVDTFALTAPKSVNAIGAATAATSAASSSTSSSSLNLASASAVALAAVGVYAKIDPPMITALRIENGKVSISVEGTSDAAEYFVVPGERPDKFATALDAKNENGVFTFDQPKDASFFKVIGVRKFK